VTSRPGLLLLAFLAAACVGAPAYRQADARYELFVLGTAQDGGVPHFGCQRPCCEAARRTGRKLDPACLGIVDHQTGQLLLLEATPGVEAQVALLQELAGSGERGRRPVDAVLLTHAHIGHYLGLAHFGREVASTRAMPTWCSPRMAAFLRGHGPWKQLVELGQLDLREFAFQQAFEPLPGLAVEAIPVPHRDEFSDTVGFRIRGPERTVLFVPDIDSWGRAEPLLAEILEGVDVAYLDATFYDGRELPDRNLAEIRHPLMVDTMERLAEQAKVRPGSIRFIHLNHTNPALHDVTLRQDLRQRGFWIAEVGERIAL
jgi:pyrroloquinoline quinone biosynthesis protein B